MNTIPVHYYTTETVENEFFSFVCRYCERQLSGDYVTRNLAAGRYENLCLTCVEEIRATVREDMKAIRKVVAQINS